MKNIILILLIGITMNMNSQNLTINNNSGATTNIDLYDCSGLYLISYVCPPYTAITGTIGTAVSHGDPSITINGTIWLSPSPSSIGNQDPNNCNAGTFPSSRSLFTSGRLFTFTWTDDSSGNITYDVN